MLVIIRGEFNIMLQSFVETTPLQRRLVRTAVPHIFSWTRVATPCIEARKRRAIKRRRLGDELSAESDAACHNVVAEEVVAWSEAATAGVTDFASQT